MLLKPKNLKSNVNFSMSLLKHYHHYHHLVVRLSLANLKVFFMHNSDSWNMSKPVLSAKRKAFDLTEVKKEPSLM